MTWSRAALAAAAAGALLAGCAEPAAAPTWERAVGPRATPGAPATTPAGPVELRLTFAGDVHFTGRTLPLLDEPETAFGKIKSQLEDADLTIVNLETAVTERGEEEPKRYHFRAPPTAFDALRAAGIDAASVANNHTLDYGEVGLLDTLLSAGGGRLPGLRGRPQRRRRVPAVAHRGQGRQDRRGRHVAGARARRAVEAGPHEARGRDGPRPQARRGRRRGRPQGRRPGDRLHALGCRGQLLPERRDEVLRAADGRRRRRHRARRPRARAAHRRVDRRHLRALRAWATSSGTGTRTRPTPAC